MNADTETLLPQWADIQCPNGDTFRVQIDAQALPGTDRLGQQMIKLRIHDLEFQYRQHLKVCEWLTIDVEAESMYELHPVGTRVGFRHDVYVVGEDGYWRNKFGMEPAGQRSVPPEAPRHCKGCRCDEQGPPAGRRSHGGGWPVS